LRTGCTFRCGVLLHVLRVADFLLETGDDFDLKNDYQSTRQRCRRLLRESRPKGCLLSTLHGVCDKLGELDDHVLIEVLVRYKLIELSGKHRLDEELSVREDHSARSAGELSARSAIQATMVPIAPMISHL
jgi:hypothetical protein